MVQLRQPTVISQMHFIILCNFNCQLLVVVVAHELKKIGDRSIILGSMANNISISLPQ